ncbi:Mitogen-activated protein kinase SLT2/MPK1 [Hypsizygus marmoreus]|uniref:mitogen-activated protein kinase n=1 Tax=Hypsizygus marmoreus TaxID=39966 RepID=A0A369JVM9_HYPMA|nr:Mitogen-activated protein kinase SLT2/MPK1 [Hypsizygus marmoreus]
MIPPQSPKGRSPRGHRNRGSRARSKGDNDDPVSPLPSPGSWNVDRGRSRVRRPSNPFSEDNLRRRGYHSLLSSFGKVFHVEKRWKLIREMGSGAYGVVISAADEISGETVAIKLVTRVFDKVQLAKRALREITLLRHFANHENITGLIDVDAISQDFNEIYIFMEPMEADLHQIIKSGQSLTNEHVQYFLYQILRGMKYVHSASVIHRDLKPGNLLVNADCELKICDFGLSRGFDSTPDEYATHLTEYVATRWYRAPEIMLAFRRYNTAIDVWSIGCILAELLLGKPLFKGKDYVDQLNKVLDVLGTPDETVIRKIGSEKAQAYVRSLPFKKTLPFRKLLPAADPQALDLLGKMLAFDPDDRITVPQALEHPWLAAYHDESDEPECSEKFEKWRKIEQLETLDEFREALWNEIEEYRREVRGVNLGFSTLSIRVPGQPQPSADSEKIQESPPTAPLAVAKMTDGEEVAVAQEKKETAKAEEVKTDDRRSHTPGPEHFRRQGSTSNDPVVTYARRSSLMQPSRQGSTYSSPLPSAQHLPTFTEGPTQTEPGTLGPGSVVFPTQGYVVPARSRTGSMAGGEFTRRLLRTLSTVSIHESAEGLAGGLAGIAPIGKYIVENQTAEADAPPSEIPRDFGIEEGSELEEGEGHEGGDVQGKKEGKEGKFEI